MKTFVINLKHAVRRRQAMEAVLARSPFAADYCFFEAVGGRRMTADELRCAFTTRRWGDIR